MPAGPGQPWPRGRSPPSRSIGSTAEAGAGEESGDPHERDCEGRVKLSTVPPTTHTKLQTMDLTEKEINDEIRTAGGNVGHHVANTEQSSVLRGAWFDACHRFPCPSQCSAR